MVVAFLIRHHPVPALFFFFFFLFFLSVNSLSLRSLPNPSPCLQTNMVFLYRLPFFFYFCLCLTSWSSLVFFGKQLCRSIFSGQLFNVKIYYRFIFLSDPVVILFGLAKIQIRRFTDSFLFFFHVFSIPLLFFFLLELYLVRTVFLPVFNLPHRFLTDIFGTENFYVIP